MNKTFDELIALLKEYNPEEVEKVTNAYNYAKEMHKGQYRESGEEYITHPVNVAYILAEMHADGDTICAGLLHDTIEDTPATKEDIAHFFNQNVANLVDGVTKISKLNFSSKKDEASANTRKIIVGITTDVRIIIIKLADRLHNMRTIEYKKSFKQKENALETMEIFVPLAYYIGAYRIKSELEDISLKCLLPDVYQSIKDKKEKIESDSNEMLKEMLQKIQRILLDKNIPNYIKIRTKNIYGIYKKISEGCRIYDIHDLLALKIMVDDIDKCYQTLRYVHELYHPVNEKFKDYICNPKTNMYRSLHTTVFSPEGRLVQAQIRTHDMDKVASFGLATYWDIKKGEARYTMQKDLKNKYQFFKSLIEINKMFGDNEEFVRQVKSELFSDKIYVYTMGGQTIELPKGSTIVDFAYRIDSELGNTLVGAFVNDKYVDVNYELKNKDRVKVLTDDLSYGPREDWLNVAKTTYARRMIREFNRKI
ncbi:MAG: bifunctional (p)ppGpp synthetase/guanosine-3',5'-bis(diphosphate) 3'-pyrophosphohydrolase [Bacilli bacterium]|nr:bifunctional (p)ppGpp synthetase/guanosine-3',5'-bis(diphosphate) 3'-pyrophosphohydrolase [Bacilli bacterium]